MREDRTRVRRRSPHERLSRRDHSPAFKANAAVKALGDVKAIAEIGWPALRMHESLPRGTYKGHALVSVVFQDTTPSSQPLSSQSGRQLAVVPCLPLTMQ